MSYSKITPGWELGKWLVICDRCGFKYLNDEVQKEPWTNLIVCKKYCWEPRHEQEFIRPRPDAQAVPFTRPETTDQFVGQTYPPHYLFLPGTAGNYASTPDSMAVSITGDIDIRVKVAMDDWTSAGNHDLIGKWAANNQSYLLRLSAAAQLILFYTVDGSSLKGYTSTSDLSALANGSIKWLRAILDIDNGASGNHAKFYTSDDGVDWAQLGATVTAAGVTSVFDGNAQVRLQGNDLAEEFVSGKVYYAEIRNGIDGPVVAKFDPLEADEIGDTSFVSSTGEVWTINQNGSNPAKLDRKNSASLDVPIGTF